MKLRNSYIILLFVLPFISCSKEDCNKDSSTEKKISTELAGSWRWVRTDGGIGNTIHETPASTGRNIELIITVDNKYFIYTNSSLTSQGSFTLPIQTCIHDGSDKRKLDFSSTNDTDLMIESNMNNILTVSDEYFDGTISEYQRN
jgi:hypothetical protein